MRKIDTAKSVLLMKVTFLLIIASCLTTYCRHIQKENESGDDNHPLLEKGKINNMVNGTKWSRCFLSNGGRTAVLGAKDRRPCGRRVC